MIEVVAFFLGHPVYIYIFFFFFPTSKNFPKNYHNGRVGVLSKKKKKKIENHRGGGGARLKLIVTFCTYNVRPGAATAFSKGMVHYH